MRFLILVVTTVVIACATTAPAPNAAAIPVRPTSCAGRANTDTNVYDTTQVTERPIVRNTPPPQYPRRARDSRVQGRVVVALVVKGDGSVDSQSVHLVRQVHRVLDTVVVNWAFRAQFWPACLDRRPVAVRVAVPIDFTISGW